MKTEHQPDPEGRLIFPPAEKHIQGRKPVQLEAEIVQPEASGAIQSFAKPKIGYGKLIVSALVSAILVALIAVFINTQSRPPQTGENPTSEPSATTTLPGMPFVDQKASAEGRWRVLETRWDGDVVNLKVEVACDSGNASYSFRAFVNSQNMSVVTPTGAGLDPILSRGRLSPGTTAVGWVQFAVPRADFTLVLTDFFDRQLSAIMVKA